MNLLRHVIAGALIAALPVGSALACNTAAWNGTAGANAAVSDDPDASAATNAPEAGAVPRYSGRCGLMAAAAGASFVGDNSPNNETVYRARFYVRPGQAGSKIFEAWSADNGGGTQVVGITFTGTAFQFDVNGAAAVSTTGTINVGAWYSIEISYDDNGPFSATVATGGASAGATTQTVNTAGNAGALTVGSVRVGHISGGGAGANTFIDEFDSSRGATAIGRLCPGDANNSNSRTVADAAVIRNEVLSNQTQDLITGQPDANDSGGVTVADASLIRNIVLQGLGACPAI